VLRQPGLLDRLHDLRVNVAGPANLAALLNSLQMGFRTLAIQQRSSEVWQVLRAVKTEFNKFGDTLAAVKKSLDSASNKLGQTETRTRVMLRTLRDVEVLPEDEARVVLREGVSDQDSRGLEDAVSDSDVAQEASGENDPRGK
jgi:DNA recombination protein RmuC